MNIVEAIFTCMEKALSFFLRSVCPCLRVLLISKPEEYKIIKRILGFLVGFFTGIGVYFLFVHRLEIHSETKLLLGSFLAASFGLSFSTSRKMMCVIVLIVPSFAGRSGRTILVTLALTNLLQGPVTTLVRNTEEAARLLACTTTANFNLTQTRFRQLYNPVKEAISEFVVEARDFATHAHDLRERFIPVELEVEDNAEIEELMRKTSEVDESHEGNRVAMLLDLLRLGTKDPTDRRIEKIYAQKMAFRCEDIYNEAVMTCERIFHSLEAKCYSFLPLIGDVICWTIRSVDVCQVVSWVGDKATCDARKEVDPGFGKGWQAARRAMDDLDKMVDVAMKYKVMVSAVDAGLATEEEVELRIRHEFHHKKMYLMFGLSFVQSFMSLLFVLVFISSLKYHNKYVKIIDFDNVYVTAYFKRIDGRRRKQGKYVLLPLKKWEETQLLQQRTKAKLLTTEFREFVVSMTYLILQVVVTVYILLWDVFFYQVLLVLKQQSKLEVEDIGYHKLYTSIEGTGLVAKMIRKLFKELKRQRRFPELPPTRVCVPKPVQTDWSHLCAMAWTFAFMFLLICFQTYVLRLRSKTCAFFYYKWEKRRTLYLYNEYLRRRRLFLQYAKQEICKNVQQQILMKSCQTGAPWGQYVTRVCSWLNKNSRKRRCILCEDDDIGSNCHACSCEEVYCSQCWKDIMKKCCLCQPCNNPENGTVLEFQDTMPQS